MNVFTRNYNIQDLKDVPLADYTPQELVAFVTTKYPGDARGAIKAMRDNYEIGFILWSQTNTLLGGLEYATSQRTY